MMAEVTLNGHTFPLKPDPPKAGRLLLLARAERRGDQEAMVAYLDFFESMLHPDADMDAFEDCIANVDLDEISDALKAASESYKVDPSSAGQESSSRSSSGSAADKPTSKVVSFSKGTVEVSDAAS